MPREKSPCGVGPQQNKACNHTPTHPQSLPLALLLLLLVLLSFFDRHGLNVSPLSRALFKLPLTTFWPPRNGLLQTAAFPRDLRSLAHFSRAAARVAAKLRFDRLEDVARLVQGFTGADR